MRDMKRKLLPSILSADFARLSDEVVRLARFGVDALHVDVMDGIFVPNITIGPCVVKALRKMTDMLFDVHLMIDRPSRFLEEFVAAGADYLTIHQEAEHHTIRILREIKRLGARPGIALNPETPVASLGHVVEYVDLVLIMTVNPGFGGQSFMPLYDKVRQARKLCDSCGRQAVVEVDGGVCAANCNELARAGMDWAVAGSAVFSGNPEENVRVLKEALAQV